MTVAELIAALQVFHPDLPVVTSGDGPGLTDVTEVVLHHLGPGASRSALRSCGSHTRPEVSR